MTWRLRRPVRAGVYALLAAFFIWAFVERYWQHRDCFNEQGRCYDPLTQEVITLGSAFWGVLAAGFSLLCLLSLFRGGKSI